QCFGERLGPFGLGAVRFAKADSVPFGVMDHARFRDVRREVRERTDDPPCLDVRSDHASWIDALETESVEVTSVSLEIPPRDPVLRADDDRVGTQQRMELRSERGQAMGFYAEEDHVGRSDRGEFTRDLWRHLEIAVGAGHAKTALLHRAQMRTAREEDDI